jgi:hypothetical protein
MGVYALLTGPYDAPEPKVDGQLTTRHSPKRQAKTRLVFVLLKTWQGLRTDDRSGCSSQDNLEASG